MEWRKHRAIQSVDIVPYMNGRKILVEGKTEDYEVYDELERLRIYCSDQLDGCRDTLAQMKDELHTIDIYKVEWRIEAKGFNQSMIQFEFQRERMFEILSDEIYQGDSHVFLRELLQNSIDAIRMRREILRRSGIPPGNLGAIWVTVNHRDNGDAEIVWFDNGIGMNEHIVRNYLAIAGRSYYQSDDFNREGLDIYPISRFGIGILSCFLVADHIEIITRRDKHFQPADGTLQIIIPSMRGRFLIKPLDKEANIGTTVRVFVKGSKIRKKDNDKHKHLDATEYLKIIAGFVEFPIIITEDDKRTIILHPKENIDKVIELLGDEYTKYKEHKLRLGFPWELVFAAEDLELAREVLKEQSWDMSQDLNLAGHEGVFSYFVPSHEYYDFETSDIDDEGYQTIRILDKRNINTNKILRYNTKWHVLENHEITNFCKSAKISEFFSTYVDGILIPFHDIPRIVFNNTEEILPTPILKVNIHKAKLNIGRTELKENQYQWEIPIYNAYFKQYNKNYKTSLLAIDVKERLFRFAQIMTYHYFKIEDILNNFPIQHLPVPILKPYGVIDVCEFQEIDDPSCIFAPKAILDEIVVVFHANWFGNKKYNGFLKKWNGEKCIINSDEKRYTTIGHAMCLSQFLKKHLYHPCGIQFLKPPKKDDALLPQKIYERNKASKKSSSLNEILLKIHKNPLDLNSTDLVSINRIINRFNKRPPVITIFERPFDKHFAYGFEYLNLRHPIVQHMLECIAQVLLENVLLLSHSQKSVILKLIGRILSKNSPYESITSLREIEESIIDLFVELKDYQGVHQFNKDQIHLSPTEFIDGTIMQDSDGEWIIYKLTFEEYFTNLSEKRKINSRGIEKFGGRLFN